MCGRVVVVGKPLIGNSGRVDEVWYTAIDDDQQSIHAVKIAGGFIPDIEFSIVGKLSTYALDEIMLPDGRVTIWTDIRNEW